MSIKTKVEGDPAAIRAAANWAKDLKAELRLFSDYSTDCWGTAARVWEGFAADGYRDRVDTMRTSAEETAGFGGRIWEELHSYADQLEWCANDMAGFRQRAERLGLDVVDLVILHPAPAVRPPAPGRALSSAEQRVYDNAWASYQAALVTLDAYLTLREEVQVRHSELSIWITHRLIPLALEADAIGQEFDPTDILATFLTTLEELGAAVDEGGAGAPGVGRLSVFNAILSYALAAKDLAAGASPVGLGLELVAQGLGSAGGAALLGTTGLLGAVLGPVAGGLVAALLARATWESLPAHVRDRINHWYNEGDEIIRDSGYNPAYS